jgi:hypothetical protein
MRFFHDTSRRAVKTASLTRHSFHASRELIRLRASKSGGSVSLSTKFSTKKVILFFQILKKIIIKIGIWYQDSVFLTSENRPRRCYMDLWTVNRRKNFYTMGTRKTVILDKIFLPSAARIRDESAGLRRKRRALDLRPPAAPSACRSVLAHAYVEKYSSPHQVIQPLPGPLPKTGSSRYASSQYTKIVHFRPQKYSS